jgi:hypothetical protein
MPLDRLRSFGIVRGHLAARYEQDGLLFDVNGQPLVPGAPLRGSDADSPATDTRGASSESDPHTAWGGAKVNCGARTRRGTPCACRVLLCGGRCRRHGGCSTGPRTPEGKARSSANLKNARRAAAV